MCAGFGNPYAGKPQQPSKLFFLFFFPGIGSGIIIILKRGMRFNNCSVCSQVTDKELTLGLDMEIHMEVHFKRIINIVF